MTEYQGLTEADIAHWPPPPDEADEGPNLTDLIASGASPRRTP